MKISVVIATRNRKEDLRNTIIAFQNQTYQNKEIIIVDNASEDGTKEMMENDFPEIEYLWLPDNIDIRAQNLAISMSSGDIIWRTDDDSNPETHDVFEKVVKIFEDNSDIHIIATEDIEVKSGNRIWDWYPYKVDKKNVPEKGYKSHMFHGTGAAIRKEVFEKVGGYWNFGHEEVEFCTRAILGGFNIRYFPNLRTLHYSSPSERFQTRRWLIFSNQLVRYNIKYFPLGMALSRIFWYMLLEFSTVLFRGVKFSAFAENLFRIPATMIHTYREERQTAKKEQIEDITLGTSAFKDVMKIYKHLFASFYKKILRK